MKRFIRGGLRRDREDKHILRIRSPWVFKHPSLITDMEQIGITAIGLFLCHRDVNAMLLRILDELSPGAKLPLPPGGDDLQLRFQRHIGKLKSDLIVPLSSRP